MNVKRAVIIICLILLVNFGVDDAMGKFGGKRNESKVLSVNSSEGSGDKVYWTSKELVEDSKVIVRGKVQSSERSANDGGVFLISRIKIQKELKGRVIDKIIDVKNRVGYVKDGTEYLIAEGLLSVEGDEHIYFLKEREGIYYNTLSSMQGSLKLPKVQGLFGLRNGDFNMFYNKRKGRIEREILRYVSCDKK